RAAAFAKIAARCPYQFRVTRLFAFSPVPDAIGPSIEGAIGITTDVEFFRAMQSNVNEIGGEIFSVWPFASGIGDDKGNIMFPQECEELRHHETLMPNFDGITERTGDIDLRPGARFQVVIMVCPQLRRFTSIARQQVEKIVQAFLVPAQARR